MKIKLGEILIQRKSAENIVKKHSILNINYLLLADGVHTGMQIEHNETKDTAELKYLSNTEVINFTTTDEM